MRPDVKRGFRWTDESKVPKGVLDEGTSTLSERPLLGFMFPVVYRGAKGEGTPDRRSSLRPVPLSLFVL